MATKLKAVEPNDPPANLAIWTALSRTDPAHTKGFSRAGGFKGTAIKPIWIIQRLTEQFGPVGEGWGMGKPQFEVVRGEGEVLVYCTVECWHTAIENTFVGVGGDKVVTKRKDGGLFHDDEAFKKAFTDAVGNAFKFLGVGADVHMGLFEDSKYLAEVGAEFRARDEEEKPDKVPGIHKIKERLRAMMDAGNAADMTAEGFRKLKRDNKDDLKTIRDAGHTWWGGDGADFEGFGPWMERRLAELETPPATSGALEDLIGRLETADTKAALDTILTENETFIGDLDREASGRVEDAYDKRLKAINLMDQVNA